MDKIERAAAIVAANEALVNADAATMTRNQLFLVDGSTNAETKIGDDAVPVKKKPESLKDFLGLFNN